MKIQALKFSVHAGGDQPVRRVEEVEVETPQDLEKAKEHEVPLAYVVRLDSLENLREHKDLVIDRGTKHPSKPLKNLLLRKEKIPLIDGDFKDAGQAKRSVFTLVENACKLKDRNIYFIGLKDEIFSKIRQEAGALNRERDMRRRAQIARREAHRAEFADIQSWLLHELMQQCAVPQELAESYVGISQDALLVRQLIILAAGMDTPVLICGDTGTGKELVAWAIYRNSNRHGQGFIPVNCAGIPGTLLESELFGHVKGAFTGAIRDKRGLWEAAGDGTLFLDEIGELNLEHQAKILRALEKRKIRRVGTAKEIEVRARVIAATNRDLFSMVQTGEFREDLYYRLRGFLIRTPALRDHPEDIPILAQFFWNNITDDGSLSLPKEIQEELQQYRWPGNARELKAILNNLHALFGADNLTGEHLKAVFYLAGQSPTTAEAGVSERTIILHRAECLRHLRRVQEVVHAIQFRMQRTLEQLRIDQSDLDTARSSLKLTIHDLEMLCRQPSLFHSDPTFFSVWDLLGRLTRFRERLLEDMKRAQKYWGEELSKEFRQVQATVFREIERILEKVGSS